MFLIVALLAPATMTGATEDGAVVAAGPHTIVSGQYLIQLTTTAFLSTSKSQLLDANITLLGFGVYLIEDGPHADPLARAEELSQIFGATVVPNGVSQLLFDNTEPDATDQWSLDNFAQFSGGVADADIDAAEAWDAATGAGIVVAVLDSGADLDHPDLAANVWVNPGEVAGNGIDDDGNGYVDDVNGWDFISNDAVPEDTSGTGHGTAVAGIIAAPINGTGIAGIAPKANIMVLRVCSVVDCAHGDVIEALAYAAANGAHVANLSFGGESYWAPLEAAVQGAIDAGVVVVTAAGNFGDDNGTVPFYPANYGLPGMLSVAMTDHADALDLNSNFGGTTVHLGAPGVSIRTLDLGAGYASWTGTSFAAPNAAGVAALVRQHRGCYTAAFVASVVASSGDSVPALSTTTISGKRANAFETLAVDASSSEIGVAPSPAAVSFSGGDVGTEWTFGDGDSSIGETAQHVYEFGTYTATDGIDTYEIAAGSEFLDTCTSLFADEIMWLSASGITAGCAGSTFCPNKTVNRAQMASFLARALDLPAASGDYFTDDDGNLHEDNINRLFEAEITFGCGGSNYCPGDDVTRAQMASFLERALDLPATSGDYFEDDNGNLHEANINALAASGITAGCGGTSFCPSDGTERDEMAAFLFRGRSLLP